MNKAATSKNANKPDAWTQAAHLPGVNGTGGLVDITDGIYPPASARLRILILKRTGDKGQAGNVRGFRRDLARALNRVAAGKSPSAVYDAYLMQAALVIVQSVYGYSWPGIVAALDNKAGRDTTWQEAERQRAAGRELLRRIFRARRELLRRIFRARRRLDLVIKAGVFRRKEGRL